MNTVCLTGRLVRDPKPANSNGTDRTWFTIAVGRPGAGDTTDFIPVTCFAGTAVAAARYLQLGSRVAVTGQLRSSRYEKHGETVYSLELIARAVDFMGDPAGANGPAGATDEEPF